MHEYFENPIDVILDDLESFFSTLRLDGSLRFNKKVERDLKGILNPSPILDKLFFQEKVWLGIEDFFEYYVKDAQRKEALNSLFLFNNVKKNSFIQGIRARLYRTQLSLLTEYHAFFMCKKVFGKSLVTRSIDDDVCGVDFTINFEGEKYRMHVFIDTKRSNDLREYKRRHKNSDKINGIHVNFPYAKSGNEKHVGKMLPNGFVVYTLKYVGYLKSEMEKGNVLNQNIKYIDDIGFVYDSEEQNIDRDVIEPQEEETFEEWMTI